MFLADVLYRCTFVADWHADGSFQLALSDGRIVTVADTFVFAIEYKAHVTPKPHFVHVTVEGQGDLLLSFIHLPLTFMLSHPISSCHYIFRAL